MFLQALCTGSDLRALLPENFTQQDGVPIKCSSKARIRSPKHLNQSISLEPYLISIELFAQRAVLLILKCLSSIAGLDYGVSEMQEIMDSGPKISAHAYLALMGVSAVVCALVAGNAAHDAFTLLQSALMPDQTRLCRGILTLVASGIFTCLSYTCVTNFAQACRK